MSFGEKILKYQDDILRDLATLVSIPSVRSAAERGMPFGRESTRALQTILSMAEGMGLSVKNVDNYAGHAEYGEGEGDGRRAGPCGCCPCRRRLGGRSFCHVHP